MQGLKDSFKRKLVTYTPYIILLLLIGASFIGMSVTRTLTNTSDTTYTYIINSKGSIYDVTQSGLQSAIWDLNSTNGGWVELPVCTISCVSPIIVNYSISLRGAGIGNYPNGNPLTLIQVTNATFVGDSLIKYGPITKTLALQSIKIEGIMFKGNNNEVVHNGLLMENTQHALILNCVFARFHHVLPYGIGLNFTTAPTYMGYYNQVQNCFFYANRVGLKINPGSNADNSIGNHFQGDSAFSKYGLWIQADTFKDYGSDFDNFDKTGDKCVLMNGSSTSCKYNSFIGSRFEGNYDGIYIDASTGGHMRITDCSFATTSNMSIDDNDGTARIRDCQGFVTEVWDQNVIVSGQLYVRITHASISLSGGRVPWVMVTPKTSTSMSHLAVNASTSTYFDVRINGTRTINIYFYYYASTVFDGTGLV